MIVLEVRAGAVGVGRVVVEEALRVEAVRVLDPVARKTRRLLPRANRSPPLLRMGPASRAEEGVDGAVIPPVLVPAQLRGPAGPLAR